MCLTKGINKFNITLTTSRYSGKHKVSDYIKFINVTNILKIITLILIKFKYNPKAIVINNNIAIVIYKA